MTFGKGHHLHLIDGSAFIFRAYHALPPLTRKSDGLPVGAVSGFCNMLLRYVEGNSGADACTHAAVIFDYSSKTFRNDIYPAYKAHRPDLPEDLKPQFPLTRDATRAFNIACIEIEDYEADDIIATLACQAREAGGTVTIISSDKDLMQLVGDGVEMFDAMKNRRIGVDEVFEKFGVEPARVVDVQALAGDSTDNVPGAPGIGIKTAALLIQEYGDLETLLARAGEIRQDKRRAALIDNADLIRISKRLVTLDRHMTVGVGLDELEVKRPDLDVLLGFLAQMEFRTIVRRVSERFHVAVPPVPDTAPLPVAGDTGAAPALPFDPAGYEWVRDPAALAKWVLLIYLRGYVVIDARTSNANEMQGDLAGIALAVEPGSACYIPLGHRTTGDLFDGNALAEGQMPLETALAVLKPVLSDPSILKIGHNIKVDAKVLARYGVALTPVDDTMLMSYAMYAGAHYHALETLSERYLDHLPTPLKALLGAGKAAVTFERALLAAAVVHAAEEADITLRLWQKLKPQLSAARVATVYETLERPLVPVLGEMEAAGILVDRATLSRMSGAFAQKMAALEEEIHALAGEKFNLGSPKQLGEILFDRLSLQGGVRGKAGAYNTGADILEDLASEGHDLPARVLDWRQLSKLKSTYTDTLQEHINPDTGRVHTSYSIAGSNTGRLASTEPNLQNIPIRSEEGRRIRQAFVAAPGKKLISLDYSQIELRILAHVADIGALKTAFRDGLDIHAMTASEMFNVPMDQMTKDIRSRAKAINFGVIYGISGFGLARNLRIPRDQAQKFIDTYFERFPGIRAYMDATVAFAREHGFVRTLFGRKMHTPEINARGPTAGNARRAAINAPIQGAAADIIRRAMVRVPHAIAGLPAKMLLQVHDELLFEVEEPAVQDTIAAVKAVMEGAAEPAVKLSVPLVVDAGVGDNWGQAH